MRATYTPNNPAVSLAWPYLSWTWGRDSSFLPSGGVLAAKVF
jgi:hypothetical protein